MVYRPDANWILLHDKHLLQNIYGVRSQIGELAQVKSVRRDFGAAGGEFIPPQSGVWETGKHSLLSTFPCPLLLVSLAAGPGAL